jgi:hypothetical protein
VASRFYFPASTSADVSPAFDSGWLGTSQAVRRKLSLQKGTSAIADGTGITLPGTVNRSRLDRQYVSAPLAAQTISGTVKLQLLVKQSNADDNIDQLFLSIRVVSNDGSTFRGTLLSLGNYGPTSEYATTQRNKTGADGDSLSSVVAQEGDRLVVEIGHSNTTAGTTPTATARWGENAPDAAENETDTSDAAGWIEFSGTVTLRNPGAVDVGESPDVVANGASIVSGDASITAGEAPDVAGAGTPIVSGSAAIAGGEPPDVAAAGSSAASVGAIVVGEAPDLVATGTSVVTATGAIVVGEAPDVAARAPAPSATGIAALELLYLHRALGTDGATPTQFTASGGSSSSASSAGLSEPDGTWDGAVVRWNAGPNAGRFSTVESFAAGTLQLADPLPTPVASGHTFTLFLGGKFASSERVPQLATPGLAAVTGFAVVFAAALNGEGTGVLAYDAGAQTLTWQPPGGSAGAPVAVAALLAGDRVAVFGGGSAVEETSRFLLLERNEDDLPDDDAEDDLSLDLVPASFLARVRGAQAASGVVTYRPFAIRNGGAATVLDVQVYCATPFPAATATTLAAGLGTGAGVLQAASLDGWGGAGWVYNATKGDVRYYYDRSGNGARVADPAGGHRGFTATAWDDGDVLEPFPWIDIGLDAPGVGNVFEDPATIEDAPSGVSFTCPRTAGDGLDLGDLVAAAVHAVWVRVELPPGARPVEGGRVDVRLRGRVPMEA